MGYQTYNWFSFYFFIALAITLFSQTYINLVVKKVSGFGFDRLVLLYVQLTKGRSALHQAQKLLGKDPKRIRYFGFHALISAFVATYAAFDIYSKYLAGGN
jgi:hypothetical protein